MGQCEAWRRARAWVVAGAMVCGLFGSQPDLVFGQAFRVGGTFPLSAGGLKRYPDVAYDSTNNVYLMVSGAGTVVGTFVSVDGVPIGAPFGITNPAFYSQTPRVVYSPQTNSFLVTWLDARQNPNLAAVWGRIVSYSNGAPAFATGEFHIATPPGGAFSEHGPDAGWASGSQEFLVTWRMNGPDAIGAGADIRGQRVAPTGALLGGEIMISQDSHWQGQPAVGYNPNLDEFYVAYTAAIGNGAFVLGRRIKAGSGALLDQGQVIEAGASFYVPEVMFDATRNQYFIAWFKTAGGVFNARFVNPDNSLPGGIIPLLAGFPSYDGFGVARNEVSDTYFAAIHDRSTVEDAGFQIQGNGVPDPGITVTVSAGNISGNFNPRTAASSSRAEWMVVTAQSFTTIVAQRIGTNNRSGGGPPPGPPPPPPPPPPPSPLSFVLNVSRGGSGTVTAPNINCGTDCSETYAGGAQVTLGAVPSPGHVFAGWFGDTDCLDGIVIMNGDRSCGAKFNAVVAVADARAADLTADGLGDVFLYHKGTGDWFMGHNDGSNGFNFSRGQWSADWTVKAANFNGDAFVDLFLYNEANGLWFQALNNGMGGFTYVNDPANMPWEAGWEIHVGRLNNDNIDDLFVYKADNGRAFMCFSTGTGVFTYSPRFNFDIGWRVFLGQLDGVGPDDIFFYKPSDGAWMRGFNDGNGGLAFNGGVWSPSWTVRIGDFNGDRIDDVFLYHQTAGVWFTCLNTIGGFRYQGGVWSPIWRIVPANLNADGLRDLFLYDPVSGVWFEALSNGSGNFSYVPGQWSPGWEVQATELNAMAPQDLFLYNPADGNWFKVFNHAPGAFTYAGGRWSPGWTVVAGK